MILRCRGPQCNVVCVHLSHPVSIFSRVVLKQVDKKIGINQSSQVRIGIFYYRLIVKWLELLRVSSTQRCHRYSQKRKKILKYSSWTTLYTYINVYVFRIHMCTWALLFSILGMLFIFPLLFLFLWSKTIPIFSFSRYDHPPLSHI